MSRMRRDRVKAALGELDSFVHQWGTKWGDDMPTPHIADCLHTATVEADVIRRDML